MRKAVKDRFLLRLAASLRETRTTKGLSLAAVAGRTGISSSSLSRIEVGEQVPSLPQLFDLSRCYRVSLVDMIGGAL